MDIKFSNIQPIGTSLKKEHIFLGTIIDKDADKKVVSREEVDIFYESEIGYTRFADTAETFKGDGSDGKGIIKNIVPVFDYYKEDEIAEGEVNGETWILAYKTEPLEKYNHDYNFNHKAGELKVKGDSDLLIYLGCFISDLIALVIGVFMILTGVNLINSGKIFFAVCIFIALIIIEIPFFIFHNHCAEKQVDDLWGLKD